MWLLGVKESIKVSSNGYLGASSFCDWYIFWRDIIILSLVYLLIMSNHQTGFYDLHLLFCLWLVTNELLVSNSPDYKASTIFDVHYVET